MGAQRVQHGYHAGFLRARHRGAQGPERLAKNRVRESADRRGEDGRRVHVLLRTRRREGDNAVDTVLRAEERHAGARGVRQDGIPEGEDQAGIRRQLLQSCERRNLHYHDHVQGPRGRFPGAAESRSEEILGLAARPEEEEAASQRPDVERRRCLSHRCG